MKNDSASFFGPCFWGKLVPGSRMNLFLSFADPPKARRAMFFSHWAANAVAQWACQFPNAIHAIRPRRVPTIRWKQGSLWGVRPQVDRWSIVHTHVDLPEQAEELLTLIDGDRTIDEILHEAQIRLNLDRPAIQHLIDALVANDLIYRVYAE